MKFGNITGLTLCEILSDHCRSLKQGTLLDVYTANKLLKGYTKWKKLPLAHKLFYEMPHRDTVSWNTLIAGYINLGNFETAWSVLRNMTRCGFGLDGYTFGAVLKGIGFLNRVDIGQQVHSVVLKMGFARNVYSGTALLDMYAKCDRIDDALDVFRFIVEPNTVSWNALMSGFAQRGDRDSALWLLSCMEEEGVDLDDGTFAPLLTLLDEPELYKVTAQIHSKIVKRGLVLENTVCNAIITSYSECGSIGDAQRVFDSAISAQDIVTWNSMLAAYLEHGKENSAFQLFTDMQILGFEPDIYSYTSIISACVEATCRSNGRSLHGLVIKRGLEHSEPISNALIAMYLKSNSGSMEDSLKVFESMEFKDRVTWNSILTGYSQNGSSEDAVKQFAHMRSLFVEIDHYALSAVLRSCSDLATFRLGQQLHALAIKLGFESNEFVASSLIFMYSKCGMVEDARNAFEETFQDSSVSWNSIIFGYAQHGQGHAALDLFHKMRERKVKLDHITFVAVLTACSHIGLVKEGYNFLKSMESEYGIVPRMEHYACAVDLVGRAGRIDEAFALVESMPFEPDTMVWKTLLGACRTCGNIELASQVANKLLELEPEEHCTYTLLSDLYSRLGQWKEKASVKTLMRERHIKKVPGWSWIEIQNEVHAFNAEDHSHPHDEAIYLVLEGLIEEIKRLDVVANIEQLMQETDLWSDNII